MSNSLSKSFINAALVDPSSNRSVENHILHSSGLALQIGRDLRLNQAIVAPEKYLEDKQNIMKALIHGSDGTLKLNVELPGEGGKYIPRFSSLIEEWQGAVKILTAQGVDESIAKAQADQQVGLMLSNRLAQFSISFPGIIHQSDSLASGQSLKLHQYQVNAERTGIATHGKKYRKNKYKKYKKHYKKARRETKKTNQALAQ